MKLNNVIIVGGGTAGWMTACMLAHQWQSASISITLVESVNVGTIGVGEGSTPFLRDFFSKLGISESTWMPACDATYKCGIDFPGWTHKKASQSYFHPFYGEADSESAYEFFNSCNQRRQGFDTPCHPDDYFISHYLAKQNKSPFTLEGGNSGVEYGYHFDAGKLGLFLAKHAKLLGVLHIQDDITDVHVSNTGIENISTKHHGRLSADFFVDCSGLKGLLIQQKLGEQVLDYSKYLANNAAVAISTSKQRKQKQGTYTLSKGLENGWMWSIPLHSRVGNGYVYSDNYISKDEAERALRSELQESNSPALHIKWNPGRITKHWKQNCLAVGLSQGFLEPLEAPMLNLVQQTLESFIEHASVGFTQQQQARFNSSINLLIDGTRDYLQAHYLLNSRSDSNYWIHARENEHVSDVLRDIVDAWRKPETFEHALAKHAHKLAYGKTSWYCILAGMHCFEKATKGELELTQQIYRKTKNSCLTRASQFVAQAPHLPLEKMLS